MLKLVHRAFRDGKPIHVAAPHESGFGIYTKQEWATLSDEEKDRQHLLRHIVFRPSVDPGNPPLSKERVSELTAISEPVTTNGELPEYSLQLSGLMKHQSLRCLFQKKVFAKRSSLSR